MAAALGLLLVHRQALAQTLAGGAPPGPNIPAQAFPPMCSIAPQLSESFPRSTVLTVSDGTHPRCVSVIIPGDGTGTTDALPMPVLFEFHGAGGNARNYGHGADATQTSWAQLAAAHSFVVAGGEALQWSDGGSAPGPPSPGKVPAECKSCFEDAGCGARADCTVCCQENQGRCSQHCMPSHTPFPDAEAAVCHSGGGGAGSGGGGGGRRMLQEGPPTGSCGNIAMRAMGVTAECCDEPSESCANGMPATCNAGCAAVFVPFFEECATDLGPQAAQFQQVLTLCGAGHAGGKGGGGGGGGGVGGGQSHWHGGQWLIPEIQTDATGLVCNWSTNPELRYIDAVLTALEAHDARLFDLETLFFTGCSMGSALTVWLAQCMHERSPEKVTAFGSQSTGLKVCRNGTFCPFFDIKMVILRRQARDKHRENSKKSAVLFIGEGRWHWSTPG
jgi:hypothetical protein